MCVRRQCQPIAVILTPTRCLTYDNILHDIADCLAPLHTVRRRADRRAPWFDSDCRDPRRHCRLCERRYRKTGSTIDMPERLKEVCSRRGAIQVHVYLTLPDRRQWVDAA